MIELVASLLVFLGSFFLFSAAVGLLRMPDAVSRIQTGTKATTLGACLILAGLAMLTPQNAAQYILLIVFIFISNPISSHALARAGQRRRATKQKDRSVPPVEDDAP